MEFTIKERTSLRTEKIWFSCRNWRGSLNWGSGGTCRNLSWAVTPPPAVLHPGPPRGFLCCFNYITPFLVVLFSPQKEKLGKWVLHASSFIVCYFGRYSRLSLKLILFKLCFHANVCSPPNFGKFFAMPSPRRKPKIRAGVTV